MGAFAIVTGCATEGRNDIVDKPDVGSDADPVDVAVERPEEDTGREPRDPNLNPFSTEWSAASCPVPPDGITKGYNVGDQIAEVELRDCEGNTVFLSDLCGAQGAWLFAAHAW